MLIDSVWDHIDYTVNTEDIHLIPNNTVRILFRFVHMDELKIK